MVNTLAIGLCLVDQDLRSIPIVPIFMTALLNGHYLSEYFELNYSIRHLHLFKVSRKFSSFNSDKHLYSYLAGLIEGDGHFNVPKALKTEAGKTTIASIEVVFALKDLPTAEFLKKTIGGSIYKRKDKNCVR